MKGGWFLLLGGLIIWAAHFLALYVIGEALGLIGPARLAIVALTLIALAANILIVRSALRITLDTDFDRWRRSTILTQAFLSAVAIVWQSLPALL
ncbi:hypothetical protein [Sphingomonas colocasiae]|uniref:Uncharacterized protein n=1 Tax=Sphingomonas colocasiae TaxID=1848973 RepID=A0ABS7PQA2_9SPHN|nr:hypothetical protein [Sphingomonas colocasiae]MBY8823507.1 hypothetical protein [Sphingomonas colocasiae]